MAGFIGRKVVFTWKGAPIEGVREKGIALNGEPIDVTDDDADGVRVLLEESAEDTLDISLSGVTKDQTLMKAWFDGRATPSARVGAVTLTYPDGRVITATVRLNNYSDTGPYNDATTFEAELQSTGDFSFTPAA